MGQFKVHNTTINLKDISGLATSANGDSYGHLKLEKYIQALLPGSPYDTAKQIHLNKKDMLNELKIKPSEFITYSLYDALVLPKLLDTQVSMVNTIREQLSIKPITRETISFTTGRLVSNLFEDWIAPDNVTKLAITKLAILDPDAKPVGKKSAVEYRAKQLAKFKYLRDAQDSKIPSALLKMRTLTNGLNACSVKAFSGLADTNSGAYNAVVHGGRCNNELPNQYRFENGADIDASQCYGSGMRTYLYPLGLPTIHSHAPNEKGVSFGAWLDENEHELVPGLWQVILEGKLNFEQDLLYSKVVKHTDLGKPAQLRDEDKNIPSGFVLARREVVNAVITTNELNILRKACTNSEWACVKRLEVKTAVLYKASDQKCTREEWIDTVLQDEGEFRYLTNNQATDTRTRAWYGVSLEGFVGLLADWRSDEKKKGNKPLAESIKLIVNSTFGDIASRHFQMGNVVVANNITSKARCGVWMMAKALGLRQSITDGGPYTVESVPYFTGAKPGLQVLASIDCWKDYNRGRAFKVLTQYNPEMSLKELDEIALKHIKEFWMPYEIEFPFDVEHKSWVKAGAYWGKGDYMFLQPDGTIKAKIRGVRSDDTKNPKHVLLKNILEGLDDAPIDYTFESDEIMQLGKYYQVQTSKGYNELKDVLPGDSYVKKGQVRLNNLFHRMDEVADYLSRSRRVYMSHGKPVEFFERFKDKGIEEIRRRMELNMLR